MIVLVLFLGSLQAHNRIAAHSCLDRPKLAQAVNPDEMKSGGEFSQFFFLFPVFSFTGGVESRTPPTSPHLTPPPARRKPFVATTASRPRLPSTRARRAPPPGALRPGCLLRRPNPRGPAVAAAAPARPRRRASSECSRRGRGRGLSREPRPPPSPCVVVEGIFPFLLPLLRIGHVRLFGIWTVEHSSKSRVPVLDAIALGILIHGHVEHVGDFYFH